MKRSLVSVSRVFAAIALVGLAGCANREFHAFDGPVNQQTDAKLVILDHRVRVVNVDGRAVPPNVAEANHDRVIWVRPGKTPTRLTLGIAPHDAVVDATFRQGAPPVNMTAGVSVTAGFSPQSGHLSTIAYPGSKQNQKILLVVPPGSKSLIEMVGKVDSARKPVWGFTGKDLASNQPLKVTQQGWEANAGGGVDATPWNLWDIPDDQIEMRATTYR